MKRTSRAWLWYWHRTPPMRRYTRLVLPHLDKDGEAHRRANVFSQRATRLYRSTRLRLHVGWRARDRNDAAPHALTRRGVGQRGLPGDEHRRRAGCPGRACRRNTRLRSEHAQSRRSRRDHLWIARAHAHPESGDVRHRLGVHDRRGGLGIHRHAGRGQNYECRRRGSQSAHHGRAITYDRTCHGVTLRRDGCKIVSACRFAASHARRGNRHAFAAVS
jgi:hypothetical protein